MVAEVTQPIPPFVRNLYYSCKLTGQTAQNLLLACLFVVAGTSSAAAIDLSSLFIAILIPAVLLGPVGGAVVDRIGPSRGYAIGAVLRFLPAIACALFLESATWAWVIAFAYSAGSQIFTPSELALVRHIQRNSPGAVHSWLQGLVYGGQALGMLVFAPLLYLVGGFEAMRIGAAVGMGLLVIVCFVFAFQMRGTPAARVQEEVQPFSFRQTARFFAASYDASYSVALLAMKTLVSRAVMVALPLYLTHDIGMGRDMLIFLVAPGVLGVVVALLWSAKFVNVISARDVMRVSLLGMLVAVFALAALDYGVSAFARYSQVPPVVRLEAYMNTTLVVALPVAFLLGIVLTTSLIAARVILTETAPRGQQARVFAVQESFSELFVVLPLLAAGIGTQMAGARPTLAVIGVVIGLTMFAFEIVRYRSRVGPVPVPVDPALLAPSNNPTTA